MNLLFARGRADRRGSSSARGDRDHQVAPMASFTSTDARADARALLHTRSRSNPRSVATSRRLCYPGPTSTRRGCSRWSRCTGGLDRVADMRPNYARYRRLQALYCEQAPPPSYDRAARAPAGGGGAGPSRAGAVAAVRADRWRASAGRTTSVRRRPVARCSAALVGQYGAVSSAERDVGRYRDIIEVLDRFERRAIPIAGARDESVTCGDLRRSGDRGVHCHRPQPPPLQRTLYLLPLHGVSDAAARASPT